MSEPSKPSTYRQLYHAANDLESRYAHPSRSRPSNPDQAPLLSGRAVELAIGLGLFVLGATYLMNRSSSEEDPTSDEDDESDLFTEETGDEESPLPESMEEPIDEGGGQWWDGLFRAIGLRKSPSSDGTEETEEPEEPSKPTPVETDPKPAAKPKKATTQKTPRALEPDKPQAVTSVARGSSLDKSSSVDSKRYKDNELFTGKYARLSKALLTAPEYRWAVRLVKAGASIHGRFGRAMLPIVKSLIIARAKAHGLDPEDMLRMASMESGGDPNAVSGTGAIGVYQFTGGTAKSFGLINRFDLDANVEAGMLLAKANIKYMGGKEGALEVYISHQIGAPSAKEVFNAKRSTAISALSKRTRKNISHNVGKNARTVGEYLDANAKKLEETYQQQRAAAPFKGEVKVVTSPNQANGPVKVSSISLRTTNDSADEFVPVTRSVSIEAPATPDQTYSHKAALRGEQPAKEVAEATAPSESSTEQPTRTAMADYVVDDVSAPKPHIQQIFRLNGTNTLVVA